jgi:predicted O-linked N-acetylglucosamine transferase (SPINDLY family)
MSTTPFDSEAHSGADPVLLQHMQLGFDKRKQGRHEEALQDYQRAADLPGAPPAVFFNIGNVLLDLGRWAQAHAAFGQALAMAPDFLAANMQSARCLVKLGDFDAARSHFEQVLRSDPLNFSAWLECGHVCRQQGQIEKMLACYQQAAVCEPQRWEALLALARSLEETGQFDLAATSYHRAVAVAGALALAEKQAAKTSLSNKPAEHMAPTVSVMLVHWRMAKYRLERADAARALESMRQALMASRIGAAKGPLAADEKAEMQVDLGDILMRLGLVDEAHRAFERASTATSEATLVRLADLSLRYNMGQEAQEVLKRNVKLHPGSASAHWVLAQSYAQRWQMDEALASLAQAQAIEPQPQAQAMRASVAARRGDVELALSLYLELARAEGPLSAMSARAAMMALRSDRLSPQGCSQLHQQLFAPLGSQARAVETFKNARALNKRLRLGLVTGEFHAQNTVNTLMQPVLARLAGGKFEVTVYFTGLASDDQTRLARTRVRHWVECAAWSDRQLAQRIEDDGIDILLDLAGHAGKQRMGLFGARAAPVQASFLASPGTTGVPNMDWLLADPVAAPEGREALFSERVLRMPHSVFCFVPEQAYPYPDHNAAHAVRPLTLGSFNEASKLTPRTLALWAQILKALPQSRLLLKADSFNDPGAVRMLTQRFAGLGIGLKRLTFSGPSALSERMADYGQVDIALDPTPYNGCSSTLQALWMGVPVVTKAGGQFASRMGASILQAAGLPQWVAESDEDYVRIVTDMARDRAALGALKQSLRQRLLVSPVCQIDAYTRDFEAAVQHMWAVYCADKPVSRLRKPKAIVG